MRIGALIVAGLAAVASAAVTPQQIADGLNRVTQLFQDLQGPAQSITIVNAPLIIIGQGPFPQIISGLTEVVTTATTLVSQFPGTGPITVDADATLIFDAFRALVRVEQQFLNILIGKAGILEKVPLVGQPVATVLRQVETVEDQIAITLINLVESRSSDLAAEANSVGSTLDLAISKYEGIQV